MKLYAGTSSYLLFALRRRVCAFRERLRQRLLRPDVQLVGYYYTENLGDTTMGRCLATEVTARGGRPGMGTYGPWSSRGSSFIMGGGELGDLSHFSRFLSLFPETVPYSVCGINPSFDLLRTGKQLVPRLSMAKYICARSSWGAGVLRDLIDAPVRYAPDIAFSLAPDRCARQGTGEKHLGISLMTFYLTFQNQRHFSPDSGWVQNYRESDPAFAEMVPRAGDIYVDVMRSVIRDYVAHGWKVTNIPFSFVDHLFAKAAFGDVGGLSLLPYRGDARSAIQCMRQFDRFIATRFHAHVFALAAGVPVLSIAYSRKCNSLWSDTGCSPEAQIGRLEFCADPDRAAEFLTGARPYIIDDNARLRLAAEARASTRDAVSSVLRGQ